MNPAAVAEICEAAISVLPTRVSPLRGERLPEKWASMVPVRGSWALMGLSGELVRMTSFQKDAIAVLRIQGMKQALLEYIWKDGNEDDNHGYHAKTAQHG